MSDQILKRKGAVAMKARKLVIPKGIIIKKGRVASCDD